MAKAIILNPFRVLGIKANATAPEKQAAKNSITAYLKIGSTPKLEFDSIDDLDPIIRSEEMVQLASNQILDDNDKIINAVFWFISGGLTDEIALNKLIEGRNSEEVFEIFKLSAKSNQSVGSSFSSIINYSTIAILQFAKIKDENILKDAIISKYELCKSTETIKLIGSKLQVQGSNINYDFIRDEVLIKLKEILISFFPEREEFELLNNFFLGQKEILEQAFNQVIKKINVLVNDASEKRNKYLTQNFAPEIMIKGCIDLGKGLLNNTKHYLTEIRNFYGSSATQTQIIYETVFEEINYLVVTPNNKFQSNFSDLLENKKFGALGSITKSIGLNGFDGSVTLIKNSLSFVNGVDFPIKTTLESNLKVFKEQQTFWKENFYKLSNLTESGSSSQEFGCLGKLLFKLIFYAVMIGIISFLANLCS